MAELKLWDRATRRIFSESCMFAAKRESRLLFPAEKILRVCNPTLELEYEPGRDFLHRPGRCEIVIPPDSRIPFLTDDDLHPAGDEVKFHPDPDAIAVRGSVDGRNMRFHAGNYFARHQVEVDYIAKIIDFEVDPALRCADKLPRFRSRLADKSGGDLVLTLIGDSISAGFNATKFVNSPPYQPPYAELVRQQLELRRGAPVKLHNRAIDGTGCRSAEKIRDEYEGDAPDLLMIAYGMNDFAGSLAPEVFIATLDKIISSCRQKNPHTEYLLISSMNGNPTWQLTVPGKDAVYSEEMRKYAQSQDASVALVDNFKFWRQQQKQKSYYDITGNGVNHPNDYGHRFQASAVLNTLDLNGIYF